MTSPTQALWQASLEFEFVTHIVIVDVTLGIRDTQEESLRPAPVRNWDRDEGYFSMVLFLNNAWLISQLRNRVKLSTEWKLKRESGGRNLHTAAYTLTNTYAINIVCIQCCKQKMLSCICVYVFKFTFSTLICNADILINLICCAQQRLRAECEHDTDIWDFLIPMRLFLILTSLLFYVVAIYFFDYK